MADKGIVFSGPMVCAQMAGLKTQTRRIIKGTQAGALTRGFVGIRLPYKVGDRLYVREHWRTADAYDDLAPSQMGGEEPIIYLSDDAMETWGWGNNFVPGRRRLAMHMPRWATRLTNIVTQVRVQRLQDITDEDAIAEGVDAVTMEAAPRQASMSRRSDFAALWNSLHGPDAWDRNDWVAAYTFTVHHGNVDCLPAPLGVEQRPQVNRNIRPKTTSMAAKGGA